MRRYWKVLSAFVVVLATACAPGYSVKPLTLSPTGATFEFTYSVSSEYPATVKKAEAHCQQYQKHAKPVGQPVPTGPDRAVATFECVA